MDVTTWMSHFDWKILFLTSKELVSQEMEDLVVTINSIYIDYLSITQTIIALATPHQEQRALTAGRQYICGVD